MPLTDWGRLIGNLVREHSRDELIEKYIEAQPETPREFAKKNTSDKTKRQLAVMIVRLSGKKFNVYGNER